MVSKEETFIIRTFYIFLICIFFLNLRKKIEDFKVWMNENYNFLSGDNDKRTF